MKNFFFLIALLPFVANADIQVVEAWARASVEGSRAGAAYVTLLNNNEMDDALLSASSPEYAERVEIHQTKTDSSGVMQMLPQERVILPTGVEIGMLPGGTHIMLMGLKQPLVAGYELPIKLTFENAPAQYVKVDIKPTDYARPSEMDNAEMTGDSNSEHHTHH